MSSIFIVTKNPMRQITTAHMCIVVVANLYTHRLSTRYTSPKHSNTSPLEQLSIANNICSRHGCQKPSPIDARLLVSLILCRLLHLSRANAYNSHIISIGHLFNPPNLAALKVQRVLWELAVGKLIELTHRQMSTTVTYAWHFAQVWVSIKY